MDRCYLFHQSYPSYPRHLPPAVSAALRLWPVSSRDPSGSTQGRRAKVNFKLPGGRHADMASIRFSDVSAETTRSRSS